MTEYHLLIIYPFEIAGFLQSRSTPLFTTTIDGTVTPLKLSSQLRVPMTVAREGVAAVDQLRGGTVLDSFNSQNGVLSEGDAGICEGCNFDPAELSGNFYVFWDADNLYVTAVVKDDSPLFFLEQDNFYVRDASLLPQDAVGWQFNPGNDVEDNNGPVRREFYDLLKTAKNYQSTRSTRI